MTIILTFDIDFALEALLGQTNDTLDVAMFKLSTAAVLSMLLIIVALIALFQVSAVVTKIPMVYACTQALQLASTSLHFHTS
jgi:hypothetical protein